MEHHTSIIGILGIGTAVPDFQLDQADTSQRLAEALKDSPDSARWAKRIFKQCGVETRYTCEPNLLESAPRCRYFPSLSTEEAPSTADRMKTYKRESIPLGLHAAREALLDGETDASDITHLITVSCTGQFLPGMDAILIYKLGLSATVNRIPLNFLGCAAGLKAIGMSRQIVSGDRTAKVLVVSVELCTLHIQPSSQREALFGASFFGDGASACIVGFAEPNHKAIYQLGKEHSFLLPNCAEEMVWEVGNHGFDLYLSPDIPKLIGRWMPSVVEQLLKGNNKLDLWAIHPGGKGIIDTMQDIFRLTDEQISPSRNVLRHYGNVSSATILFVLDEMKRQLSGSSSGSANGIALAFGPGLSVEMIEITFLPSITIQQMPAEGAYV